MKVKFYFEQAPEETFEAKDENDLINQVDQFVSEIGITDGSARLFKATEDLTGPCVDYYLIDSEGLVHGDGFIEMDGFEYNVVTMDFRDMKQFIGYITKYAANNTVDRTFIGNNMWDIEWTGPSWDDICDMEENNEDFTGVHS